MDSGYKGLPESARPYLDYNAIGAEYHAGYGGVFTSDGYTLRRSSTEPLIAEREQSATAIRVYLQTGGMRSLGHDPFVLTLPTTSADIHYANRSQHKELCDGPSTYRAEKVDGIIDELLRST